MNKLLVQDIDTIEAMIEDRKQKGNDRYDEVWEGVYVMPSMPSLPHQGLVHGLSMALDHVVVQAGRGAVYPGANVTDRRDWKENFRVPDIVVLLEGSQALDCDTFILGGPDFLVEIESPGDATDEKIPFYSEIGVRELLIVHRDTRALRLYRHDGQELTEVKASEFRGKNWLVSTVVPLAFRRKTQRGRRLTEVTRTDNVAGSWTI